MSQTRCLPVIALALVAVGWTVNAGSAACISIKNVKQLQAMRNNLAGDYCLANDIDASTKPNFQPIGSNIAMFTGKFNGNGHVIRNLRIRSGQANVGLFGFANAATIRNVTLQNVAVVGKATSTAVGGLVGVAFADGENSIGIANVHVSGDVRCLGSSCDVGGLAGAVGSAISGTKIIRNSSSSADVTGSRFIGGLAGFVGGALIRRTYATGAVRCTESPCMAGGLVARLQGSNINLSFATGPVEAADGGDSRAGGLVAYSEVGFGITSGITASFAEGPVTGGVSGYAAAFIGQHNGTGPLDQVYGIGPVSSSGATTCGLTCSLGGTVTVTNAYWDTDTTGQATSNAGTGMTTAQLRAALPAGFDPDLWGITANLSYPFFTAPDINFAAPLATLAPTNDVFTFLPVSQHDESQYNTPPADSGLTALATVYTMIARAIGITHDVKPLKDVAIDRYFWDEAAQRARWRGPVTTYATPGALTPIPGGTPIEVANVIGVMDAEQLVILRGRYREEGGGNATHWMLGTLYRKDGGGNPTAVIAHDPSTGQQVTIDPVTKRVVSPENFPLDNFKVIAYQPVTVN